MDQEMTGNDWNYSGKSVLVVGGTSGINLGVARAFANAGASVGVMSRSQIKVDNAVEQLKQFGGIAVGFSADVRNYEALQAGIEQISTFIGSFDAVISGAAGNFPAHATSMSPNGFAAVVNIDLLGTYHALRASYPFLKKPGSSVINISAPQSYIPMLMQSHVCAAKAGVDMITRTLAMEWGGDGIRVNSIVPGPIEQTEGMKRLAPTSKLLENVTASVPLGRLGTKSDIGQAALFLASPMASYITGAIVPVDGGWSLGGVSSLMDELAHSFEPRK